MKAEAGRGFKPYPGYKDSGVEWLGEVPEHWGVARVGRVAAVANGSTPMRDNPAYWLGGTFPWLTSAKINEEVIVGADQFVTTTAMRECHLPVIRAGSVLVAITGEGQTRGRAARLDTEATISQHLAAITLRDQRLCGVFVWRFIQASYERLRVESCGDGSTRAALTCESVKSIRVTVPATVEQRHIAAFLNRETARIDALVAKKERLIELLQEKRTAFITRAVTKGLDPSVPMKDSGVEWLAEVPAHWDVKRLWHLTPANRRIMYGIVLPGPNVDDGVPIVKGGDVCPERLSLDRLNRTTREIEASHVRSRLRGGDLVFAIRGSIGEVAIVPAELEGANLTQDAARVAYTSAIHGPWLLYTLKSSAVFAQLEAGALGATIRGVNIRDLKRASIPLPPRPEQEAIASFLDRETASINALIAKVRTAVALLKEYRAALISAAVTGKIDVREEVAE